MLDRRVRALLILLGLFASSAGVAQGKLDGRWKGVLEVPGASLTIEVSF